ncbi:hypothetical protein Nepgr_019847 [Nepenthes gracilis]|uniref:Major facilitator superfamily (MFS) profile domain-containing protein n=1 Tax=Nepenthes gracilis TaxID=150966 RepID=A0AAD3SXU4_NEPGR|nr:hypothetical protein Nepgr_019847 [Nepenthes gracilis]
MFSPGGSRLPKRWVLVLLCFTSFRCATGSGEQSTAILPKSQEFNWKSAIVGPIQIFSFRSYLLTQIVGSLWADKIGGKLVLGFGVMGWSWL